MSLEVWSLDESDPGRRRRLAIGYMTGIAICTVAGVVGASIKAAAPAVEEEETVVDVQLAPSAEAPKPEPPPPPPDAAPKAPSPPGPKHKPITTPTEVPTEMPKEGDPNAAKGDGDDYGEGSGEGSGNGVPGGTGTGPAVVAPPPPPPPPPPPRPSGPIQLPENGTPPQAVSRVQPPYPEDARRDGVEATVVVRFVVTESGDVANVTVVRGHPLFDAAVVAAVKSWHFKPAMVDGRPVAVFQTARFPFKLKT